MAPGSEHGAPLAGGLPTQYVDVDPDETAEWIDSLDSLVDSSGNYRARYMMLALLRRAAERNVGVPSLRSTDYINSIPPEREPWFPGDEKIEREIRRMIRWNAAIMVHRAQRPGISVGGHISTYASSATLYEIGFNHFFKGPEHPGGADQLFFQGHASPGMYARAFIEGRITEAQMDGFRQELSHPGGGLPSYPHPRLMPWFWQFPTVSMGLGPLNAIYQARFNKYLEHRGLADTSQQKVYAFLGDGETDEVDAVGALSLAAREELDNLVFVVNCNLQRLDGPVRGNGKIIQELESLFRGAGWNVIKVVWGRAWDHLLAADRDGALGNLMNNTHDGDFQTYKAENGAFIREHFFGRDPRTAKLVEGYTDDEIWSLQRGGHDYRKMYAAYEAAQKVKGQPTVILAKTIKGWTLGSHFEARNSTHQMKKLTLEDLKEFRDRLHIPIADSQLDEYLPPYYNPGRGNEAIDYMFETRRKLGGFLPTRRQHAKPLPQPADSTYSSVMRGSGKQPVATTMAFVRLLKDLIKDEGMGAHFVPIIPDEARTFGMDSLFPTLKIYSPHGQQYTSVDRELMLSYKESESGQILHEGINEAGSVASFTAAGTSYSTHGVPMIPVYIFYSMFGFGFVLGATAGRTTLNGEGLQHEDGHSQLLASTNPAVVAYDPAYAYEIGHIVKDGLRRMYGEPKTDTEFSEYDLHDEHRKDSPNVYYYLTMYNEPYPQPAEPEDCDVEGIIKGMHLVSEGASAGPRVQLLASGVGVNWALRAQELLAQDWQVAADVWSVTSWNQLRRDGLAADRHNMLNPQAEPVVPYVTQRLEGRTGPVVAVSDWMRAVQDQVREWVPQPFVSLGTDGWGLSDTRGALRRHFLVDAESITVQALAMLAKSGEIDALTVAKAIDTYQLHDPAAAEAGNTEGSG